MGVRKDSLFYVTCILDSIKRIEEYTLDIWENDFTDNILLQDTVLKRIETIVESVKKIPRGVKKEFPHIPWERIAKMNEAVEDPLVGLNVKRAWIIVKKDIPALKDFMREIEEFFYQKAAKVSKEKKTKIDKGKGLTEKP